MQKTIQNWEKVILIILEILWNYCDIQSREGIETLRTMFRLLLDCFIFYCLSLDFVCGISKQTAILISYGFYALQHGWYIQNNAVAALFNMLAASRSYGNICFDQNYQAGKITLQHSVLIIKYLDAVSFG